MTAFIRNYYFLIGILIAQVVFWNHSRNILPDMTIVPNVPAKEVVKALSLGDEQFYFRVLALQIQNAGDTYGRFTPLKDYNYEKLSKWFHLLDSLDNESDYIPSLATYYFSQTQNTPDVRYMVDYLYDHSHWRPKKKWWWLIQAIYLANHKLEDKDLALKIGEPLVNTEGIPLWARHFNAFILEQKGEFEQAAFLIYHIIEDMKGEKLSREDFNFIKYFLEERIEAALPGYFEEMRPDNAPKEDVSEDSDATKVKKANPSRAPKGELYPAK